MNYYSHSCYIAAYSHTSVTAHVVCSVAATPKSPKWVFLSVPFFDLCHMRCLGERRIGSRRWRRPVPVANQMNGTRRRVGPYIEVLWKMEGSTVDAFSTWGQWERSGREQERTGLGCTRAARACRLGMAFSLPDLEKTNVWHHVT